MTVHLEIPGAPQSEAELHSEVSKTLTKLCPPCIWFPVPNAVGNVGKHRGARLRAAGTRKAGVADFAFAWDSGAGFIELKVGKNKLEPSQEVFKLECERKNVRYRVCRSLNDVLDTLILWGLLSDPTSPDPTNEAYRRSLAGVVR